MKGFFFEKFNYRSKRFLIAKINWMPNKLREKWLRKTVEILISFQAWLNSVTL